MNNKPSDSSTIAVILAGGAGQRLGGVDKGLVNLCGKPLVEHVIRCIGPQVNDLVIVANRHMASYREYGFPVISDHVSDFAGPLAGMVAGLRYVSANHPGSQAAFVPVDAPLLPDSLVSRLIASSGKRLAVAKNCNGLQPVCNLIGVEYLQKLEKAFDAGERSPATWLTAMGGAIVEFGVERESIWSINTPEELQAATATLSAMTESVA